MGIKLSVNPLLNQLIFKSVNNICTHETYKQPQNYSFNNNYFT